jgi:hypothetical protein
MWTDNPLIRSSQAVGEANAYRLWCAATALDWDCTVSEAARKAGLSERTAWNAAERKGWFDRFHQKRTQTKTVRRERGEVPDVLEEMGFGGGA